MALDCHISIASKQDLDQVVQCWKHLTIELPRHHIQPFGKRLHEHLDQELRPTAEQCIERDDAQVWILKSNKDRLLGTVSVVRNTQIGYSQPNSGVIFNLWVFPDARGLGHGQILVAEAKKWLRSQGATSIQAGWHPGNTQADRFWRKQGFEAYETIAASKL